MWSSNSALINLPNGHSFLGTRIPLSKFGKLTHSKLWQIRGGTTTAPFTNYCRRPGICQRLIQITTRKDYISIGVAQWILETQEKRYPRPTTKWKANRTNWETESRYWSTWWSNTWAYQCLPTLHSCFCCRVPEGEVTIANNEEKDALGAHQVVLVDSTISKT